MRIEVIPFTLLGGRPAHLPVLDAETTPAHPNDAALAALRAASLQPVLLHSTSWRHDAGGLVLTYAAVVQPRSGVVELARPVPPAPLARGSALAAPAEIDAGQVAQHALFHLAWLATHDPVVCETLSGAWCAALAEHAALERATPLATSAR